MAVKFKILGILFILIIFGCDNNPPTSVGVADTPEKANQIIQESIAAHGGRVYDTAHYSFTFRNNYYRFKNTINGFEYEFEGKVKGDSIHIILINDSVQISKNGTKLTPNTKEKLNYANNLNSVIYFATLPHKLKDQAVNKSYQGEIEIKGEQYSVIKVTFNQQGGGADFDDEYYYWVNKGTKLIDYLAYNYSVNGGGVRFREAYNSQKIGGIIFQDYINYKAQTKTTLADLPSLLSAGTLSEISRIETENIIHLRENN